MTNDTTTTSQQTPGPSGPAGPGGPDPRTLMALAIETVTPLVEAVTADRLDDPTPCEDYTVRMLLGHLVAIPGRAAGVGAREAWQSTPQIVEGVADGDWPAALADAGRRVAEVWSDPRLLGAPVVAPSASFPAPAPCWRGPAI